MIPIYGAESAFVTDEIAHFMVLCTKASHGGYSVDFDASKIPPV
jgi:hypothetical protein